MSDEIDRIMAEAAALAHGRYPYECLQGTGSISYGGGAKFECHQYAWEAELALVNRLRAALLAAGYRIELDPDFLLQKGRDAGVTLSEPPFPTLVEDDR